MSASEKERFFARASIAGSDQCWPWKGTRAGEYGVISVRHPRKRNVYAHRVAKGIALGRTLAVDENIHHTCRTKLCVNPRHLMVVSRADHKRYHDRIVCCLMGHEFTAENTKLTKDGHQVCLTCRRERQSKRRRERRLTDPVWREAERQRHLRYRERKNDVSE